ncbi:MAG: Eco57I restriction-modification methylase domain-containing protein [Syntrophales bacterium]
MKNLSQHTEWLSLIDISGPFITVSMLEKAFPQGLEAVATPKRQKFRAAYEEWREAVDEDDRLLSELHREWIRLVLMEMLEYDHESLIQVADWPGELPTVSSQENAGTFAPDWIVRSPSDEKPRLFVSVLPPETDIESIQRSDGWPVSLRERMTLLCRAHGVRVGLLTDGERWMLVNAPVGSTSSQASWYARLWFQEPITLKAFQSLFGIRRCFGPAEETLEALLEESLKHHEEVTDTLGEQVRRAVEVLVQCLDKADEDRNRVLLRDVKPAELYEAGLIVMMRLVFVLCAEERGLLLLGDSIYDQCYAISTLRGQLAEEADRHGPEVLDRRHDAWARLLAVFRAIYGGIEHENLRMPALGGSLFDPDRYPFLEGRAKGTSWRNVSAAPLPIDNRTVLLLLNSLQILEQSGGALLLSYRALDVEQIGHVYEGLLEHTVTRVPRVTLGLQGSQKAKNQNVALVELESARLDSDIALVNLVLEITCRSESAIRNCLKKPADETISGRVLGVCGGDTKLAERIWPFTNLIRTDAWEDPIIYRANSFMVTLGADRRETGTHYTPKSLTESIVTTTIEPVVYIGPAEGLPREKWTLKSSLELLNLKFCDLAMGSGAFLVQICRYLGEKLVETWLHEEVMGKSITVDGEALDELGAAEPMPSQLDERLTIARRLVAERCLYGVDINPLAVELAKLSIWLVTLAKGRPFGFLDHNLRSGDSLLGIHRLDQLMTLSMNPGEHQPRLFGQNIEVAVEEAIDLRKRLRSTTIRDIRDVEAMARLDREARKKLEPVELIADAMIGEVLLCGDNSRMLDTSLDSLSSMAGDYLSGDEKMGEQIARQTKLAMSIDLPEGKQPRRPFHWSLEFPEVFERGGFDACVSNPPFLGGRNITSALSKFYNDGLQFLFESPGTSCDLCSYFLVRGMQILSNNGHWGSIAVETIAYGKTGEHGLTRIVNNGFTITNAMKDVQWPGQPNRKVAIIHFSAIKPRYCFLNKTLVAKILPNLTESFDFEWIPRQLISNGKLCFQGITVNGKDFIVSEEQWQQYVAENRDYIEVLTPYMTGDDLNQKVMPTPSSYLINFHGMIEDKAKKYPTLYKYLENNVKEKRTSIISRKDVSEKWWSLQRIAPDLEKAIEQHKRVICRTRYGALHCLTFAPKRQIFSDGIIIFAFSDFGSFAVLQSDIHFLWAKQQGSPRGGALRYKIKTCFETFPMPLTSLQIAYYGETLYEVRQRYMEASKEGLTPTYNKFHNPEILSCDIQEIRGLHIEMDKAVVSAYGWDDLNLGHGFHETNMGTRFTISEEAHREVLQRLLKLNHERHEEEVDQGLHEKTMANESLASVRKRKSTNRNQISDLFDFMRSTVPTSNDADKAILSYLSNNDGWHTKGDILSRSGIPASQWQSTINQLIADGLVERQGERRGARYRAIIRS